MVVPTATLAALLVVILLVRPVNSFVSIIPSKACGYSSGTRECASISPSRTAGWSVGGQERTSATHVLDSFGSLVRISGERTRGSERSRLEMAKSKTAQAEAEDEREEAVAAAAKVVNDQEWQFFDTARINVKGGDGGDGSVGFER